MAEEIEVFHFLCGWTLISLIWWSLAWCLARKRVQTPTKEVSFSSMPSLSIFKPAPRLGKHDNLQHYLSALETFLEDMEESTELLLGIHQVDQKKWSPGLSQLRTKYPHKKLLVVLRNDEDAYANPKISWLPHLARQATGELWLLSDLDILIPKGFLRSICHTYLKENPGYVTAPYHIRKTQSWVGGFDALYVNVEFFPGVLLLGQQGKIDVAFGAAILSAKEKLNDPNLWERLGRCLADDYMLAKELGNGRLSSVSLETRPVEHSLGTAIKHYWRWQKTVRWVNPMGYAGQLLILPLLGWGLLSTIERCEWHLFGLMLTWLFEVFVGFVMLASMRFSKKFAVLPAIIIWPWLRLFVWLLTWLPVPISWSKSIWWTPHKDVVK